MNHPDVRAPVTGYRTKLVRITLGNERLVEWRRAPDLSNEASSSFMSIGVQLLYTSTFLLYRVHYFLEWRPLWRLQRGSRSHIVGVSRNRVPWPKIPLAFLTLFSISFVRLTLLFQRLWSTFESFCRFDVCMDANES